MQESFIYNITEQNIQDILQKSFSQPVLFYFWSSKSESHQDMTIRLDRITNKYMGQFILAKLNCDDERMLASQFGLRAIPTLYLFQNGQPIDGLEGNQSDTEIEGMLKKVLPNEDEINFVKAQQLYAENNFQEALPLLKQAWTNLLDHLGRPRADIALLLAKSEIELKQLSQAKATLASVALQDQDSIYHGLIAEIELLEKAANSPELQQLEAQLAQDPNNIELIIQLSSQLIQVGRHEEALALLFTPLSFDINAGEGSVKKALLDSLAALGTNNSIASAYRRKLYTLLY